MKRFAALYLPLAALVLLVTLVVGITLATSALDQLTSRQSEQLRMGAELFGETLNRPLNHLRGLVRDPVVNLAFQAAPEEARRVMEDRLRTLMYLNPPYDQARWLSAAGMELARVDRHGDDPVVVPRRDLQDKAQRQYYREAIRLAPDNIFVSALDLNVEREVVEVPHKPMLRMAIRLPLVADQDQGLIVINLRAQQILDRLAHLTPRGQGEEVLLLNDQGHPLLAPDPADAWGFMFGRDTRLARQEPEAWARIAAEPRGHVRTSSGLWSWTTLDLAAPGQAGVHAIEHWKLVTRVSPAAIAQLRWRQWGPLLLVAGFALILLGLGARRYRNLLLKSEIADAELATINAKIRAEDEIRALNANLEHRVEVRTAEANAANAAKSEFLAHMSHEIRTPLNGVLGLAQVLDREPLTPSQHDLVERIQTAGQSLLVILNDVLDFSKIEAGQLRLESRPFDLETLMAKLASLMGQSAHAKGLALRLETPATPLGPLLGDALRLEQVLINLTSNAIKFTERGTVTLRVLTPEVGEEIARLRFEVTDTGMGIAPAALAALFTPFTQAHDGIARRFGGTGLGLSICKQLVELMGGQLGADSQPGQGSTFWFEVPLRRVAGGSAAMPAAPTPARPDGPRLKGLHILVVDDSAMNRDLMERALVLEGAAATLAAEGQQALQFLKARPRAYDAVLMDVRMPVLDGLTATRRIRGELGLRELPIIAFTAGVLKEEREAARAAGVNDTLAKPLDLERMVALLLRWTRPAGDGSAITPEAQGGGAHPDLGQQGQSQGLAATSPETQGGGPHSDLDQGLAGLSPEILDGAAHPDLKHGKGLAAVSPEPPAPARAASPAGEAFPDIPGIDRAWVSRTLGDDNAFFLRLLRRFTREAADAVKAIRDALAQGERETALRQLHTLRGNAGNLGALGLMAAAGAVETLIEAGPATGDLEARLADLDHRLGSLLVASAPWLAEPEEGGTARLARTGGTTDPAKLAGDDATSTDPAKLSTGHDASSTGPNATSTGSEATALDPDQVAALREALRHNQASARRLFKDLEPALRARLGAETTQAIGIAIRELRFDQALAGLAPVGGAPAGDPLLR
ncbi:MAG: response regulator [Chromatiaceae bacterium]|nr:response regulator [Chromatiaceae bacterium]